MMKKTIITLTSLLLITLFGACSSESKESSTPKDTEQSEETESAVSYKDGTYQGESIGKNGYIRVEVTVAESKIESIVILEHIESEGISDPAIESIPSKIVEAQSLDIDTISGATVTSNAIIDAVSEALKSAK